MQTVDLGALPPALAAEIERRRATGADHHDEMWDGEYVMAPDAHMHHAFLQVEVAVALRPLAARLGLATATGINIGVPRDHRIPDVVVVRAIEDRAWTPTAALVVEVLSPRDRAWEKLGFYAAHEVDEVAMVDRFTRTVTWLRRDGAGYVATDRSRVLDVPVSEIVDQIAWP